MSIKENALLVALRITKPQLTAKDDTATSVAESAMSAAGAGQYRKDLYPKHLIQPILSVESAARAYVRQNTLPWSAGARLLPATKFVAFNTALNQFEVAYNQAVTVFLNSYASVLSAAQAQQGAMFDPNLYPDTSRLRAEFSFKPEFYPITNESDWRVRTQEEELDQLRVAAQQQAAQALRDTTEEALARLKQVVTQFASVMSRPERVVISKKTGGPVAAAPVFRDSVVDNITELADFLDSYRGIIPNEVFAKTEEATMALAQHKPETLRQDAALRADMAVKAKALLAALDGDAPPPVFVPVVEQVVAEPTEPAVADTSTSTSTDTLTPDEVVEADAVLERGPLVVEEELSSAPAAVALPPEPKGQMDWLASLYD